MNFDEALQYVIDNKISLQFRKIDGKIMLIAVDNNRWVVISKLTWTFKRAFKSAILPALTKLKNLKP